ncbi:MAG TPA: glycosyltransferase family 2 protein, partial [Candidatus Omnitrophota bacterium]|nr:glycosyltransferase family 2 protein [Candidatus Omnitrophota bacterium]
MTLSIIIPTYNEAVTIGAVLEKVLAVPLPGGLAREIIVVNDGSTDGTADALEARVNRPQVKIIHQKNQGKAGAVRAGMKQASGDILLIQDADLEYDPAQYPGLLQPILEGRAQVVYGSRFLGNIQNMSWIDRFANNVSNTMFRWLYGAVITDINTCYKAFTRKALEGITMNARNFAFETEITVKFIQKGLFIKEIPIHYAARTRQEGKKIRWATALQMFWPILYHRGF